MGPLRTIVALEVVFVAVRGGLADAGGATDPAPKAVFVRNAVGGLAADADAEIEGQAGLRGRAVAVDTTAGAKPIPVTHTRTVAIGLAAEAATTLARRATGQARTTWFLVGDLARVAASVLWRRARTIDTVLIGWTVAMGRAGGGRLADSVGAAGLAGGALTV
jgi:hypothetical protein